MKVTIELAHGPHPSRQFIGPRDLDKQLEVLLRLAKTASMYESQSLMDTASILTGIQRALGDTRPLTSETSTFPVGALVAPVRAPHKVMTPLRSGCTQYAHAVVVQSDPLALVSEDGDMLWSTTTGTMQLYVVGEASPVSKATAMARWKRHQHEAGDCCNPASS